jgi:hypothetical protein
MEQIVLYDVSESRAWLVPLICVFHEMLAYWQMIPMGYRKNTIPLAKPAPNGASESLAALSDSGGCLIEGSEEDRLTIRDLILGFSVNISKHPCNARVDLRYTGMNSWMLSWIP